MKNLKRLALAVFLLAAPAAHAAPSAVMLLQGGQVAGKSYLAGLSFSLEPGWMTYWRHPGEAGVAPQFSTAGSENLKTLEVLYPAPKIFHESDRAVFGYDSEVIVPLRVLPLDAAKPVILRLTVNYGICQKVCIPSTDHFDAELARDQPAENRLRIVQALEKVPKRSMTLLKAGGVWGKETLSFTLATARPFDFAVLEDSAGRTSHVVFPPGRDITTMTFPLPQGLTETSKVRITVIGKTKSFDTETTLSTFEK